MRKKADKARDDFNTSYQCRLFILDTHALSNQMAEQNGLKILRAILSYLAHYYTQTYTQRLKTHERARANDSAK